ncbi:MAG: LCP family protein [Nocardioidaceae bacterium]
MKTTRAVAGLGRDVARRGHRRVTTPVLLALILAVTVVLVPNAAAPRIDATLMKVDVAHGLDVDPHVVWILALGSDARPGEPVLHSRSDAIQMVGINTRTGHATIIGVPRDSYVDIPGFGRSKINAAMVYGGPQLAARTIGNLLGLQPDYVFVTSFWGFRAMIRSLGGVRVYTPYRFSERLGHFHPGFNFTTNNSALVFVRERHQLPNGDFGRSADQGQMLIAGLKKALQDAHSPGGLERILLSFGQNTAIDLSPGDLYRLAHAVLQVKPRFVRDCVIQGGTGMAGAQSVVYPDLAQAHRIVAGARSDARVNGCG